ncbi:hypothetical protein [Nostoc favosum]|uniref:SPOR domain-containing protein n=1 Tax=Nostoc favosum CHAB5714 TaxID=2780399 RepID=A0ABS8IIE1_9NOSO|nr:hypothetical protein [Nostoc favosum]MCC5604037.1 hypothetical protein [Nostoc favosum CHAB5714]
MSRGIPSQFIPFQMLRRSSKGWKPTKKFLPLLMGGWLLLIPNNNVLLAQEAGEILPPPPIPFGQQPSPQLQPAQPLQDNQLEPNFQPSQPVQNNQFGQDFQPSQPVQNNQFEPNFQPSQSPQFSQYNQNFERYLVYVDGSDFQTLQAIRRIEPSAYIRQYQGRNVIQSGVFNRVSNAQQRVSELQSLGIYNARILSFANGQEIDVGNRNFVGDRSNINPPKQASRYYVVIPTTQEQLPAIASQIRQNLARFSQDLGRSGGVLERTQPRGPHVAVGPFSDRFQAGEWNKYLRNIGYGNARVYYGK